MRKLFCNILILLYIALLTACGGTTQSPKTGSTIKAVIKPTALTASLNIGGVQMAITLPRGVTPVMNQDGSLNETALIEFISSAPSAYKVQKAKYDSASSIIEFSVIDLAGFSTDDQIFLHLIVSEGTFPKETDFSIKSYLFFDKTTGDKIPNLNPTLTTTIQ